MDDVEDVFPCGVSTGCNKSRTENEPEHLLQCLLVKILKEFKKPNVHIEQLCSILSKRYKMFNNIPIQTFICRIKDAINKKSSVKEYKIVLSDEDHCILLPSEKEVISLDSEDEEEVRQELKREYDAMIGREGPGKIRVLSVKSINEDLFFKNDDMIVPEEFDEAESSFDCESFRSEQEVPKYKAPKIFGLSGVRTCIKELKLSTFTAQDIMEYFGSKYEVECRSKLYKKIWFTLKFHKGRHFDRSEDGKWRLIK
ncbi:hypothetical protein ACFFRR_011683 [Megaselia abdita]